MSDQGKGDISPELRRAISADASLCFVDLPLVAQKDLADLKQILRGKLTPSVPVDRKRAVNVLARSERSAEAAGILDQIVANTSEARRVRAAAASHLSLMPPDVAEKALIRNLSTEDETVRLEVVRSLGSIGSAEALEPLESVPVADNEYAQRLVSFSRLTIALRTGAEGETGDPIGVLDIRWINTALKTVEGERVRESIKSIWGSSYGFALNPDTGVEFACGGATYFLFLNEALKRGEFVNALTSRRMIAGLLTVKEEEARHFTTRHLLLTNPTSSGVELVLARVNGEPAFAGEAVREGEGLRVRMRDVGPERTPTEVEGTVSNEDAQLNLRIWLGTPKKKQHGEAVSMPVLPARRLRRPA